MTAGSARHALAVARGARLGGSGSRIKKPCNTVEYLGLALLRARAGNSDHKKPYPAGGCGYAAWRDVGITEARARGGSGTPGDSQCMSYPGQGTAASHSRPISKVADLDSRYVPYGSAGLPDVHMRPRLCVNQAVTGSVQPVTTDRPGQSTRSGRNWHTSTVTFSLPTLGLT